MEKTIRQSSMLLLKPLYIFYVISNITVPCILISFGILLLFSNKTSESATLWINLLSVLLCLFAFLIIITVPKRLKESGIRYKYDEKIIQNSTSGHVHCLRLEEPFFFTTISIPFYIGKGKISISYYVFSLQSMSFLNEIDSGFSALQQIWQNNAVLLPVEEKTTRAICEKLHIQKAVCFPSVRYFPTIRSTGDGSL